MSTRNRIAASTFAILLFGALPILVYFAARGNLGVSTLTSLQAPNASDQAALIASLVVVKPLYMLLSVAVILMLFDRAAFPARALVWGFTALLSGELICGAVFSAFGRELIVSEHIHSYGMMLEYFFIACAFFAFVDGRFAPDPKRVRPLSAFASGMGILTTFLPLSVNPTPGGYQTDLYGFPYLYARFEFNQWVESRFLPIAALVFFALTFFSALNSMRMSLSNIFLSAGMSLLAFSIIRLSLGALFVDRLVWFEFWEEMIQLIVISTVAFLLWRIKPEWIADRVALFK